MSTFFNGSGTDSTRPRRSFFGLGGSREEENGNKLAKKRSAVF